jgi:hypothetical protein
MLHPQGAMIFLYGENDFWDMTLLPDEPYTYLKPVPIWVKLNRFLKEKSDIIHTLEYRGLKVFYRKKPYYKVVNLYKLEWNREDSLIFAKSERFYRAMRDSCRQFQLPLSVVYVPNKDQASEKYYKEMMSRLGYNLENYDRYRPQREVRKLCERLGIDFIDLTDDFKCENETDYYLQLDEHWNAAGTKRAAEVIWNSGWLQNCIANSERRAKVRVK